jgi:hypothetical protein
MELFLFMVSWLLVRANLLKCNHFCRDFRSWCLAHLVDISLVCSSGPQYIYIPLTWAYFCSVPSQLCIGHARANLLKCNHFCRDFRSWCFSPCGRYFLGLQLRASIYIHPFNLGLFF